MATWRGNAGNQYTKYKGFTARIYNQSALFYNVSIECAEFMETEKIQKLSDAKNWAIRRIDELNVLSKLVTSDEIPF